LANPTESETSDVILNTNRNFPPSHGYVLDNLEQILSDMSDYENLRQQIFNNKMTKRRAQAKANLAGLWGVPTRFA
jgi:hypothetical protein